MSNAFISALDDDLNNVFYNIDEFGIEFEYHEDGAIDGVTLRCIFDSDPNNDVIENSDSEYIDTRPRIRVRQVDLTNGKPNKLTDIFVIEGVNYKCEEYFLTRTGETVCFLIEA